MPDSFDAAIAEHARRRGTATALVAEERPGAPVALDWSTVDSVTAALAERLLAADPGLAALAMDNTMGSVLTLVAAARTELPLWVRPTGRGTDAHRAAAERALTDRGIAVLPVAAAGRDLVTGPPVPARGTARLPPHALVLGSGGSSGRPKWTVDTVMRRRPLRPLSTRPVHRLNWQPGRAQLVTGPLEHAATLTFFLEGLADGNPLVVQRRFDPDAAVDLAARWDVRWLQTTPYQLGRLAATAAQRPDALAGVRGLLHTAAPCPERVRRFWLDRLGAESVFEMYGASEGIGVTLARGDEWLARPGTVGRGFWTEIRILDERRRPVPAGVVGDVFMRTGRPARRDPWAGLNPSVVATPDGFRSVGDRGRLDPEGYLFLASRELDLINVGGENVYPAEVEQVLLEHPDVIDAMVVGEPDPVFGARPHAWVVLRDAVPGDRRDGYEQRLKAHCRAALPPFKVPATVRFETELPRTAAGKLQRRGG
ncbi:AMP-binding protein [Rugosimonospora africana]|uniref:Putative acid-CoA ligase n=1 Tax=Rugosimonospora africana TaxID=556532 RepID=A0A8J3QLX9_9ACTN|nr:AMP-binding protein [Rugosimonospora africana]GIH11873.1 putative acid-CoA ligase [Rugosimonospora africana]